MSIISIIAAVDDGYGIGKNNQLLCHLPADLKHFKTMTLGKPIIMGRKTYESIGKPLPGRLNIVLSRQLLDIEGVTVVSSLNDAIALASHEPEIMIIGGHSLFKEALPYAQRLYLTLIHHQFEADTFFPTINFNQWTVHSEINYDCDEKNAYDMTFCHYDRV